MKKNRKNRKREHVLSVKSSVIWSIPSIMLIVFVTIFALTFVAQNLQNTKEKTLERVEGVAVGYKENLESELNQLAAQAKPVAAFLADVQPADNQTISSILAAMMETSDAYKVLYSNVQGKAITENGDEVGISEEDYFQGENGTGISIVYAQKEMFTGNSAIVIYVPVRNGIELSGYLLLYYPTTQFDTLLSTNSFSKTATYALLSNTGNIISSSGYSSSMIQTENNLLQKLNGMNVPEKTRNKLAYDIDHMEEGYVEVSFESEEKVLYYEPISGTDLMFLVSVDKSYLKKNISLEMRSTYQFVIYLAAGISCYLIAMASMLISLKIKNTRTEKLYQKDELTGLDTQENAKLKIMQYLSENRNELGVLFVIEINDFTKITQLKGRTFGESVLKEYGMQLRKKFREYDVISHFQEEQFVLFLKNFPEKASLQREADRVAQAFCRFTVGREQYEIEAGIGAAIFPNDGMSFEELFEHATEALHVAKSMGDNQLVFYEEILPDESFEAVF